jgi:hypothetical protein
MVNSPLKSVSNAGKSLENLIKKFTKGTESFFDENPMAMKAATAVVSAAKGKKKVKKKSKAKE